MSKEVCTSVSTVIGVFRSEDDAERAVRQLRDEGFSDNEISLVKKGEGNKGADGGKATGGGGGNLNMSTGATTGGVLGGIGGILAGVGALAIPGIGPIIAAGPIAAGLSGAVAGGLAGSLIDLGIPQDRGRFYEEEVRQGKVLAAVKTDRNKAEKVTSVLEENGAYDVETH